MERRCLLVAGDVKAQPLSALIRRVLADATLKFNEADMARMHHVGYIDMSKFGRLTALGIEECAKWSKRVLDLNDDCSNLGEKSFKQTAIKFTCSSILNVLWSGMVLVIAPILAGEGVLNGLRGEYRRVEDKYMSMGMELKSVNILFDLTSQHGNRTVTFLSKNVPCQYKVLQNHIEFSG